MAPDERKGLMARLSAAMKRSKRLEITIYCVLAGLALILFITGISGGGGVHKLADAGRSDTEKRLIKVLSGLDGAGSVAVMITYNNSIQGEENNGICGVIVIAQGAHDMTVRVSLIRAVQTVLGVGREKVEIFQMDTRG